MPVIRLYSFNAAKIAQPVPFKSGWVIWAAIKIYSPRQYLGFLPGNYLNIHGIFCINAINCYCYNEFFNVMYLLAPYECVVSCIC